MPGELITVKIKLIETHKHILKRRAMSTNNIITKSKAGEQYLMKWIAVI